MISTAFANAGYVAVAAIVGLLAAEILGDDRLAGVPSAAATLGTAIAATPLALRAVRRGRRIGIGLGYAIAAVGGIVAVAAGQLALIWLLIVAMAMFGSGQASSLQARFAAADLADDDSRARAIAMVVWVGTVGAVLGPPAAVWANRIGVDLGLAEWVGPLFLALVGFALAGLVVNRRLRPDPLEVAGGVDRDAPFENPLQGMRRSLTAIWPNPRARLALVTMALSQMAMVAVMTMTPLHMRDHGHADLSTLVISVHVLGMFGLAPLVGIWADRIGRIQTVAIGAGILAVGTISVVVAGYVPALMFVGLFLLGLGWCFALIAGSALLTGSLALEERVPAQGFADVSMSLLGAVAAFSSGLVKETVGYHWLANFATIAGFLMLMSSALLKTRSTAEAA